MDFLLGVFVGLMGLNFWWLAFLLIVVLAEAAYSHHEEYACVSTILFLTLCFVVGINWWNGVPPLQTLSYLLPAFLYLTPGYLLIGGLWSLFKWYQYLLKQRDIHQENLKAWEKYRREQGCSKPTRPSSSYASENKSRITGWIAYWPFSMLGALFGDLLTWVVRSVYEALSGVYESIGNRMFKDFE